MVNAKLAKQLMITVNNKIGSLAEVTGLIASSGINLVAVCAHTIDNVGTIMFISEDNAKAKTLLKEKNFDLREEEVVLMTLDNKPGELKNISERIANYGIDLTLIYGSVDEEGKLSRIVIVSENNEAALMAIKMGKNEEMKEAK